MNCEQVDLKLKVCRGNPIRKVIVREAKEFHAHTVIVGTSKTHHRIRSSAAVAKYCAWKLPKSFSVFAVDNGKVVFKREETDSHAHQSQGLVHFHLLGFAYFSSMLASGCFYKFDFGASTMLKYLDCLLCH